MAEWDVETIVLRAARDYADQFHIQRGAGDDAESYEADLARAKRDIAKALAEHDREVADAEQQRIYSEVRGIPAWGSVSGRGGFDLPNENARAVVLNAIRAKRESADVTPFAEGLRDGPHGMLVPIEDDTTPSDAPLVHGHRQDETCGRCLS